MRLEYQILAAYLLDLLLGDPRWVPHPVKLIGRFALFLESPCRRTFKNERAAGIAAVSIVLAATGCSVFLLVRGAQLVHPYAADAVSVILLYTAFAARDLAGHGLDVERSLKAGNLAEARQKVGLIVGRDTDQLDEGEIVRATVESIAENTSDGVTAPLFFAFLAGPLGALLYKAVNTLDSTFGYKNERYLRFGWAAARLDDVVNYIPARLTGILIPVAAALLGKNPVRSLTILFRDARKHPSPNSGMTEAAMAGALGVQLGGMNVYFGRPSFRATMGDPRKPHERKDIIAACSLMYAVSVLFLIAGLLLMNVLNA